MGIHDELMSILKRKYFPNSETELCTVNDEMIKFGLPEQIQAKVKACLEKTQGSTC